MRIAFRSLLIIGCIATGAVAQTPPTSIPSLHGTVLTGERVDLPEGLEGKTAVLIVGFSQTSREQVTAWGKKLAADDMGSSTLVYYEMPVLESVPRILRGFVMKKIAEQVPDRARAHFLPVLEHGKEWKQAAGFERANDAYVLLVDHHGTVRWKTEGAVTDAGYVELKRRVGELERR